MLTCRSFVAARVIARTQTTQSVPSEGWMQLFCLNVSRLFSDWIKLTRTTLPLNHKAAR
jgi:hypothetical protein